MIRFAAVLLGGALLCGTAHAQDKTFSVTVTMGDLQAISAGLDELPRKISEPVVEKLQKQLIPQMQPAPVVVAPTPPQSVATPATTPSQKLDVPAPPFDPKAHPSF